MNSESNPAERCEQGTLSIQVDLSDRSYPILIGPGLTSQLGSLTRDALPGTQHAVLVFDENIRAMAEQCKQSLAEHGFRVSPIPVESGEQSKCVAQAERLWTEMLAEHTDRGSVVVAVGGGVVGDLAGFVAATFARGISLVQVPTTLLSQVDSSVGGKTGINLPNSKNIVGAFWQPSLVAIDTHSLKTLPHREFVSGIAEVVKYGVILLPDLFSYLEANASQILEKEESALAHIIQESCKAKALVVEQDERETSGLRAILNYGHTFAHAIESVSGYGKYLHGEAVAIGMNMAATLAHQIGRIDQDLVQRQLNVLQQLELPTSVQTSDPAQLQRAMQHDKKVEHGRLRFILPTRMGHVDAVADIDPTQVTAAINACMDA